MANFHAPQSATMHQPLHFDSYTAGRTHFKSLLDAAHQGFPVTVGRRAENPAAVVDAQRLRHTLSMLVDSPAVAVAENDGWSIMLPGLPIAGDGSTFDEAVAEVIDALREYANDWPTQLSHAPNHDDHWALVQLIVLSDDAQLRAWLLQKEGVR